jgi:hypothetical protein
VIRGGKADRLRSSLPWGAGRIGRSAGGIGLPAEQLRERREHVARPPGAQTVEVRIDHRRDEQREQQTEDLREFALRLSLGAGRGRLVRQLLTESLMLAGAGGLLGLLCAGWTSRALLFLVPADRRPLVDTPLDGFTLAFAAAVSMATALLFGLAPAVLGARVDLLPAMKQSGSGQTPSEHPAQRIWSSGLVVVQIALSLVLLTGAALFLRTLSNLQRQSASPSACRSRCGPAGSCRRCCSTSLRAIPRRSRSRRSP